MDVVALGQAKADAKKRYLAHQMAKLLGANVGLANRATSPCDLLVIGDSIAEGVGTNTGTLANRWINQFLIGVRQAYPVANINGGFGYKPAWNNAGLSAPTTTGTVTQTANGMGHRSLQLGTGATVTYTETCTSFKLLLKRSTTDAMTVTVDGSASTITAGPSGEFVYTSAALSRTSHSIVITQTAGTPEVEGLMLFDGDETIGVRLWDSAKGGAKAGDWTTAGGGSQAWLTAAVSAAFTPSLVIISLGTNDAVTVSAATFKTNMASLISAVRGQWANVPILLVGSYQPPSRQTGLIEAWANYGAQLQALADADPAIAFLDLMRRIGSIATDTYGMLNDTTHPNVKGHRLISQIVLDFVRPGVRDVDALRSSAIDTDQVWLDTPVGTTPATPARGAVLYGDSTNYAAMVALGSGDYVNELGRTVAVTGSVNPWRLGWRFGRITTGASSATITLPASGALGQRFTFKKVDSGAGTLIIACPTPGGNTQTIEGATTKTLTGQYAYITVISTGLANAAGIAWEIIGSGGTIS